MLTLRSRGPLIVCSGFTRGEQMPFIFNVCWRWGATGGMSDAISTTWRKWCKKRNLTDAQIYANEQRCDHGNSQFGTNVIDGLLYRPMQAAWKTRPFGRFSRCSHCHRGDCSDQSDHRRFYRFWWECRVRVAPKVFPSLVLASQG